MPHYLVVFRSFVPRFQAKFQVCQAPRHFYPPMSLIHATEGFQRRRWYPRMGPHKNFPVISLERGLELAKSIKNHFLSNFRNSKKRAHSTTNHRIFPQVLRIIDLTNTRDEPAAKWMGKNGPKPSLLWPFPGPILEFFQKTTRKTGKENINRMQNVKLGQIIRQLVMGERDAREATKNDNHNPYLSQFMSPKEQIHNNQPRHQKFTLYTNWNRLLPIPY